VEKCAKVLTLNVFQKEIIGFLGTQHLFVVGTRTALSYCITAHLPGVAFIRRPLLTGDGIFAATVEKLTGRDLKKVRPGGPRKHPQ
jgi:hypothetical protein